MMNIQPAIQTAQQQNHQKPETAPKDGPSSFDKVYDHVAQKTGAVSTVIAAQQILASEKAGQITQAQRTSALDATRKSKFAKHNDPAPAPSTASKLGDAIEQALSSLDSRSASMDKFINKALEGKLDLNDQQLLGLQARVSQYSLELDLTSKVVEKATSGLKDTLRTQV
jgi:hypothetical protein